ncbi:MMPL family transporter [Krasilnikoviella flava]|uniref:Putative drug exporter of the RND superfamily n=1 Tax=Krasilnikoviella flava TaxID=526729 RepID=A0A1T5KZ50_9MICO|nr:MMPL family transporter [Krasilnikoviella flava]SKC69047.1 putative drug exporter of the RND superfamily [Krasilnikoviella flava]
MLSNRARGNRGRGLLRGLVILAAIGVWLAIGAFGGQAQGNLSSVQTNDDAAFLPASAESTQAAALAEEFTDSETLPALVVAETADGSELTRDQLADVQAFADAIGDAPLEGTSGDEPRTVGDVSVADPVVVPSEDGQAALVVVSLDAAQASEDVGAEESSVSELAVGALRALAAADAADGGLAGTGLDSWVTGPAGFVADLVSAFGAIDTVLLLVALGAVLVILALVYRSPVLPFVVIFTAVLALCLAGLVVYHLAANDVLTLNGQSQGILSILVVGASVDYALLLVARYREELRATSSPYTAMRRAVRASVEPIAASAGTVIVGLLCLLLSDLSSNRSLGPVAAIGIVAAFLSAMTLLPAMLLVGGRRARWVFWPRVPHALGRHSDASEAPAPADPTADAATSQPGTAPGPAAGAAVADDDTHVEVAGHGVWSRVAGFVGRHDRVVWVVTAVVLAAGAAFVPTLDANGTGDSEVFLTQVDSVDGEEALTRHFEGVSAQPAIVVAPEEDTDTVVEAAEATDGITAATVVTDQPATAPGMPAQGDPLVVDGQVRVDVTTQAPSDSQEAVDTVADLRTAVHDVSPDALVGGAAAERLDTQVAGQHDLRTIVPVVLAVILLILVLLLRSVLAAVLLMAANVLSFGFALGVAALVFNHVLDFPGADPAVPLYAFCFLVALGVDYSIFLMTRVREESLQVGTRRGVLRGLAVTGSVITSAGVVLAATFAALGVIPLLFLAQLAFIVAFGVLVDALVVRSLLVPALVHDVGDRVWWPSRLGVPGREGPAAPAAR